MAKWRWMAGVAGMVLAAPALAQDRTTDIVVTAPTPLTDVSEATLPFPAQTATANDLRQAHATDLTDYLKRLTGGVFVNETQNNPLQPDINYRGYTASPLLGTPQGLSVYMDGVRLNQPFGDIVSWDLIPKSAIASIALVPGSNPLFGRNSLGGALSIRTKDGLTDPGFATDDSIGSFGRRTLEAEAGGRIGGGFDLFASGNYFHERGWRDDSHSSAGQVFGKLGWSDAATRIALSGIYANTDLNGNGLQDMALLAADRRSVYTKPDNIMNRAGLVNLTATHRFSSVLWFSGNAFWRSIDSNTYNGDINDGALGENLYQPNASERAALTAAGYTGFPTSGETQANTPFPKYRCIAEALLNTEPNEKCDGLVNRSATRSHEFGGTAELTLATPIAGHANRLTGGISYVQSRAVFVQSSQFAYLTPDRGVVGVTGPGAFADGTQNSENAFDARVNLTGRTRTFSAYATDAFDITRTLRIDLSARYDRTTVHNRDAITPGGGTGSLDSDDVYDKLNPALALTWNPSKAFGADAAIAQTSRAPSAIELGCSDPASPCRLPNALAGDPPLRQVTARTIEGGIHGRIGKTEWRIGAFRTDNRQDILFVTDDAAGFGYFKNFGRTRRQGIDVDFKGDLGPVRATAHYTFLDATYRSPETVGGSANSSSDAVAPGFDGNIQIAPGNRIPLIPRNIFKAGLAWDPIRQVTLSADMIAISSMYARGNENNADAPDGIYYLGSGRTQPYAVVNVGGEIRPVRRVAIYVQLSNLFDKDYSTAAQLSATGFNPSGAFVSRPFAAPIIGGDRPALSTTFYSPGAPRAVEFGVRVTW